MSAEVLITGASGFVGGAVLRRLLQDRFSVRALVRANRPAAELLAPDLHLVQGDLTDPDSLRRACRGCRYVFHVAADYRLAAWDGRAIVATNVAGTRNLMEAALAAGVERIVYTSSVATLSCRTDGLPSTESDTLQAGQAIGAYKRSKVLAEQLVLRMVSDHGLPAVVVSPSTPVGPRDVRPTPTGKIIIAAARGRMPVYVDTGLNLVHVDDVAASHVSALRHGRIGERYILGGHNVLFSRMLGDIASLSGRTAPRCRIPWPLALPVAVGGEFRAFMTGREPLATWAGVRLSRYKMFFTSAKAERELGYTAGAYGRGLRDAVQWFEQQGYLGSSSRQPKLRIGQSGLR